MKSYATGVSETNQGYAVFYGYTRNIQHLNISAYIAISFYPYFSGCILIVIAESAVAYVVAMFLVMRLTPPDNPTDTVVTKVAESIAAAFSSQSKASHQTNIKDDAANERKSTPKNKTKYLTLISNREYILMYALLIMGFLIWDSVIYHKANRKSPYWIYFPIPFPVITSLFVSFGLMIWSFIENICCHRKILKKQCLEHWQEFVAIPFLTVLSAFVITHSFWILLMLLSFPALVISKMIFFIPLSLPVIIMLQRIFSCFRLCCRCRSVPPKGYFPAAFYFFILWSPVLVLLYVTSNLLDVSEISNDPLKLILIFIGAIFITYRIAKVWSHKYFEKTPSNLPEEEEEEEEGIPLLHVTIEGQEDTKQEHQMHEEQF